MSRDAVDALLFAVVILAACFAVPSLFVLIVLLVLAVVAVLAFAEVIGLFTSDDEERQ